MNPLPRAGRQRERDLDSSLTWLAMTLRQIEQTPGQAFDDIESGEVEHLRIVDGRVGS